MVVDWAEITHFEPYETQCRCGCGRNDVDHNVMLLMDKFREGIGRPVYFHSVCRCIIHNRNEGSEDTSSHTISPVTAVDIEAKTKRDRFKTLEFLIKEGFTRIGIARTFIHADLDENKTQEISWLY